MGKKSGPPAPDYTQAAQLQAQSSLQNTTQQDYANRPTVNTPWGQQSWGTSSGTDPSTGLPITNWTQNISLSPEQQASYDAQQAIQQGRSQGAQSLLDQSVGAFQTPADWNALPKSPLSSSLDAGGYRQKAQDAVSALQAPDLEHSRQMLDTQLSNQGITRGSEAYNEAMRQQGDKENRAHLAAIDSGRAESQLGFGQDMQARQQGLSEMEMRRGQPLNELNALLTGQQVGMPQMPSFNTATKADTAQYLPAAQAQYGSALDSYNAGQAGMGSLTSGLFGLGSAAMGAGGWGGLFSMSDERLKTDIRKVGELPNGIGIYVFRFIGGPLELGLISQDVQKTMPEAVKLDHTGMYLQTNYERVLAQ